MNKQIQVPSDWVADEIQVLDILVKSGESLGSNQLLLLLKVDGVERSIRAEHAAIVKSVLVQPGQQLAAGEVLLSVDVDGLEEAGRYSEGDAEPKDIEQTLETLSKQHGIDVDVLRDLSADDIHYLLYQCPFLQVANTHPRLNGLHSEVQILRSDSGWNILDYGDAMCSSRGEWLFSSAERDQIKNPGKGTFINQAFATATQMVQLAKQQVGQYYLVMVT